MDAILLMLLHLPLLLLISSCDLNGDDENISISADDGRASSCNVSVSRLMRRRDDTKVCTDPPARVTNNRRDQAIRPPYYGDHFCRRDTDGVLPNGQNAGMF